MRNATGLTMGLDIGDQYTYVCLLDRGGKIVEEERLRTVADAYRKRFSGCARLRVALEAGPHSPWVSRLLEKYRHEVLVADPRKLRLIYKSDRKNDRADAQSLARVARLDPRLLGSVRHRPASAQADLALVRSRDTLVKARTELVNHMRGSVKAFGARLPSCSAGCFHDKAVAAIPEPLRPALAPLLRMLAHLTSEIRQMDRRIENLATKSYPETSGLRQVAGVGALTALTYVLTLADPRRFRNSRRVGAYLGLVPRQDQSGNQDKQLRITKAGDHDLRRLLVGSANYILGPFGPDTDLRQWGLALAHRGGKNAKKRAVVAVARRLAVLLHRLWVTGAPYEPLRQMQQKIPA